MGLNFVDHNIPVKTNFRKLGLPLIKTSIEMCCEDYLLLMGYFVTLSVYEFTKVRRVHKLVVK